MIRQSYYLYGTIQTRYSRFDGVGACMHWAHIFSSFTKSHVFKCKKLIFFKKSWIYAYTTFPLSVAPSPSNNMYCSWGEKAKEPNEW